MSGDDFDLNSRKGTQINQNLAIQTFLFSLNKNLFLTFKDGYFALNLQLWIAWISCTSSAARKVANKVDFCI
jgi:hypothetical protein